MKIIDSNEIPWSQGDFGLRYLVQGPHIEWGILRMKPGGSSKDYGQHLHHVVEETFFFLSGSPKILINGEEIRCKPGMAVRVDPHDSHCLVNDTEEDFEVLFIKYPYDPKDRHPDPMA